jgi:hypothetical protein
MISIPHYAREAEPGNNSRIDRLILKNKRRIDPAEAKVAWGFHLLSELTVSTSNVRR